MLRALPRSAGFAETDADEPLVLAAQADPAAFAALYERYMPRVYRYLHARTASPEEAADLTQAVFLKAFNAIDRFKPGRSPFASWLFRIARNAAVDAHRRRPPSVHLDVAAVQLAAADVPEDAAMRAERLQHLRRLIAALDAEKRELLALRYAGGLTAAQIAPLVGKNPEAVKKQLQRVLRQLKEHYRDNE